MSARIIVTRKEKLDHEVAQQASGHDAWGLEHTARTLRLCLWLLRLGVFEC